ncbi:MAG TPA: preprotein translocase subunit SecA, partial [Pricia sp.]|nr:preprotein translocase subunit SecA [Pricia sp.]
MSLLNSVIKIFVGDKSKKDVQALRPMVEQIKSFEQQLESISHDELRDKTNTFRLKIAEDISEITQQIQALEEEVKASDDIDKNEDIYAEIDKLKEEAYKTTENTLNEILPVA